MSGSEKSRLKIIIQVLARVCGKNWKSQVEGQSVTRAMYRLRTRVPAGILRSARFVVTVPGSRIDCEGIEELKKLLSIFNKKSEKDFLDE